MGGAVSVQNVVLGELIGRRGYAYGYELRDQLREFSEVLGYSDTFVYAALVALERQGLIRVVERDGGASGRQASSRVYYEVTDAGDRHFREWMTTAPHKAPLREELHMQLFEMDVEQDTAQLIAFLTAFEEQCREQLRQLVERPFGSRTARGRTAGAALVQDALLSHLQTMMEWAQRSRRSLANLAERPPGTPGRHRP
jgi:DNA-binding PadR family transcriptional regulator